MKKLSWLGAPLTVASGLVLILVSQRHPGFAAWYSAYFFPVFPRAVGRFFGVFPFSVFEVLLVLVVLRILAGVGWTAVSLGNAYGRAKLLARAKVMPLRLMYTVSVVFLVFVLTAGINYNRESYADRIGITVQGSYADELVRLYLLLVERATLLSGQIETDADGYFALRRDGLYEHARQSMRDLNALYGGLGYSFPRAKAPMMSRLLLSNMNISGFFSPWTMEANYNGDIPGQSIPFVINHELAHVAGHMREDEANFIAYLASRNSSNADFKYSATYTALVYTLNAMRRAVNAERYAELFGLLPDQIVRDFAFARRYWQAFEGRPAEMATRANDAYLRMNQQEDGVQSYGRMVDLMLAYYRELEKI
ncbi:MAG: DUF3810 domain-containing protein [Defluviitaleaceae bacterium]|nr:DUF3810 domain-containing protein [Defluviitaleaceae bacterium]